MTTALVIAASVIVDWGAILAAVAAIIVAIGGVVGVSRRVGKPNGKGNVVEMSEAILLKMADMSEKIGEMHSSVTHLSGRLEDELMHVHRRIDEMAGRR